MFTIEIIKAIVLGVVEGLTEWLPVSSTGHMILVDEFMRLNVSKEFMDMFLVVIQLGAILAVVVLNFDRLNPFSRRKTYLKKRQTISLWGKVIVGCIPAAVIGLALNDFMEEHFMNAYVVAAMLILYGVLFIVVENYNKHRRPTITDVDNLDYKTALIIGFFQVLSLVPGTSRSGSTILGGILFGTSRIVATEYTFFLAIPVMFGASALKLFKFGLAFSFEETVLLLVGMVVAFIVSIISIKFLLRYVRTNDFKAFGWYRIIVGILVLIFIYI
ncbi:undecaprenyl-diphosphatase [Megamonas hypermegale]|uniref:undecaprenyl-diphosphate phosphatase n=1 Tax=Megamonas hypermegale TaxID=158847 RepID=UPI000B399ADF|nr:undecaprenyl-diphosphate phosphatase [Megamonas hypermegale]OUO39541.1 undecaprenyl-diphosphatase [Megamonas hypermegale]HJG07305.1 undecaprenyl-diphosphate phosphatase [Megamonas hypermegale]